MRVFFRHMEWNRVVAIILLLLGGAVIVSAQEQRQKQQRMSAPPDVPVASQQLTSELTRDNLDRVAASPSQLKSVLVRDTGLMVELKRLMAKEASDNGQVIADQDLTDAAVYERLTNDVKFRSMATRLVQKYGYLRPSINPESDMAKEQDLVLKERAKRMVQIEAQEDQAALQLQTTGQRSQGAEPCRTGSYDENNSADAVCNDVGNAPLKRDRSNPENTYPQNDQQQFPAPDQGIPLNPNAQVLRAQAQSGGLEMMLSGLGENSSSYDALANLLMTSGSKNVPDSLVAGNLTTEQLELAANYSNRGNNLQGLGLPNSDPTQDLTARNSNRSDRPDLLNSIGSYPAARATRNRLIVSPPETVHRTSRGRARSRRILESRGNVGID